jgi:hypothetical protein
MKSILSYCSFLIALCGYSQDWQQVGSGIDGNVICMAELDGKIYVGGNYTGDLNYISQWDPITQEWTDISNGFISYAIMGMTVHNGELYVSGLYQWTSGDIIASYNPETNVWQGHGDAGGNGYSKKTLLGSGIWTDMAEENNAAQIRGFAEVNGEMFVHKVETADTWDDYTFLTFDDNTFSFAGEAMDQSVFDWFQDLEVVGSDIYCTGGFYIDPDFQRIARYSTLDNMFYGLPGCPENSSETALHHEGVVYFGGSFQSPYNHVVAYTIADGSWANVGTGLDAAVADLVVLGDTLYAIGTFATPILHVAQIALTPPIGVEEEKESSIHVYPSPFQDELYFTANTGLKTVIMYDISGKLVLQETTNENRINTSGLAPGLYVLEMNGQRFRVVKE